MEGIYVNDVPKGSKVRLKNGSVAIVRCAKKGIIRTLEVPVLGRSGMTDVGDVYVDEIALLLETPEEGILQQSKKVVFTEAQTKQLRLIREMGF